jgi:predicted PurR-regulated permease PerM
MQSTVRVVAVALAIAAVAVLLPLWPAILLAAWLADLSSPLSRRLGRKLGGRPKLAAALGVTVVLAAAVPFVAGAVVLVLRAREFVTHLLADARAGGTLASAIPIGPAGERPLFEPGAVASLVRTHGEALLRAFGAIVTASATALIGVACFAIALYCFGVDGRRIYAYFARALPLDAAARRRLVGAFRETGRGLLVGTGGTALAQGAVAAVIYAGLGVGDALTLGALTGAFALLPAVGTMAVWGPVAGALALSGHPVRAAILVGMGIGVIGTIDNVLRPWLARIGRLRLPASIVFFSMMGGLQVVGGWGVILGPLVVRLAKEAVEIARERRAARVGP